MPLNGCREYVTNWANVVNNINSYHQPFVSRQQSRLTSIPTHLNAQNPATTMQLKPLLALFLTTSLPVLTAAQPLSRETNLANPAQAMQATSVFATDLGRRAVPAELTSLPPDVMEVCIHPPCCMDWIGHRINESRNVNLMVKFYFLSSNS